MGWDEVIRDGKEVYRGSWMYNGRRLQIWITLYDIDIGSYDDEDPLELRYDRKQPTYYLWFEQGSGAGQICKGHFSLLDEAITKAERVVAPTKIKWETVSQN